MGNFTSEKRKETHRNERQVLEEIHDGDTPEDC